MIFCIKTIINSIIVRDVNVFHVEQLKGIWKEVSAFFKMFHVKRVRECENKQPDTYPPLISLF